ncbi:MAG: S8 family serine peptidase [Puniceicoccaceae bacterium]
MKKISVNVLLNVEVNTRVIRDLQSYGRVQEVLSGINALTMQMAEKDLESVRNLPFVAAANPDAERYGAPIDTVPVEDFLVGLPTWNMDVINVMDTASGPLSRSVQETGAGVYVAVLDTGLKDIWTQFFPEERIADEYARSFTGGPFPTSATPSQPNKWEHDQSSHGTHVTSTILGYNLRGTPVAGVAPLATVIPVKTLNQNGSGWSSTVARGIVYVAELKMGPLADYPVVINMSLGGSILDAVEQAALDYALDAGVIIVAAAGNAGEAGMGYPGGYAPVISVAATGWTGEWFPEGNFSWWLNLDDGEPNNPDLYYITDFSSRELDGQELDVAAPGSWVVGPYKLNSSNEPTFYFLGGTSMASPHVAGVVALMLQKNPNLTQAQIESILKSTAIAIPAGCREILQPDGSVVEICWGDDANGSGLVTADAALAATPAP